MKKKKTQWKGGKTTNHPHPTHKNQDPKTGERQPVPVEFPDIRGGLSGRQSGVVTTKQGEAHSSSSSLKMGAGRIKIKIIK